METTRDKLIHAAFEEIFSHGYQGASLSDILAKAGCLLYTSPSPRD